MGAQDFVPPVLVRATRPMRRQIIRSQRKLRNAARSRRLTRSISEGYVAVDFCNGVGIGARLVWCLQVLAYCEDHELDAEFRFSLPGAPKIDFFSPFFSVEQMGGSTARRRFVRTDTIRAVPYVVGDQLTLERGSELARTFLRPRPEIMSEVNEFWAAHHLDDDVLGVHYRGTDKVTEAPRVTYESMAKHVKDYLATHSNISSIFVSSDERSFIEFAKDEFGDHRVVSRDDFRRAQGEREVHRDLDQIVAIQQDAIVNCLLLARCRSLIKTASFLSAFSALLNPDMETFIINTPNEETLWFPERQMLERQQRG